MGVDLGGTKIELAVFDEQGKEHLRQRAPTPHTGYDAALHELARLIVDAEHKAGARCSVGVGMPGAISPRSGRVFNAYNTPFNGRRLKHDLEEKLAREVRLENDANCFALSEALDGAARGATVVFGAILGTGAGGGIVVDGRVIRGHNAIGGEWGHTPLPWMTAEEHPGPPCYCGRRGCIETFLSGPGLARDYQDFGGTALTPDQIARRAADGETLALDCLARYEDRMARALGSVINVLDPEVIVLGGGLSNIERVTASVPKLWAPYVFSDVVRTRLVRAAHGDSSGVRGAARLWDHD